MWDTSGHSVGRNRVAICNAFASQISDISLSIVSDDSSLAFLNLYSVPIQKYPTINKTIFSNIRSFESSWLIFLRVESFTNDKWRSSKLNKYRIMLTLMELNALHFQ